MTKTPKIFAKTLLRIADRRIGAAERAFLEAIRRTVGQIDTAALRRGIATGDVHVIAQALGIDHLPTALAGLITPLQRVYTAAGRAGETALGPRVRISFTVYNPFVLPYVKTRTAELVTVVTNDVKANIRRIMADKFRRGSTVQESAQAIRAALQPADLMAQTAAAAQWAVGLTERQVQAVLNYRNKLYDGVQFANGEIDAATVEARADRYAAKLLRYRANMIARTETIKAQAASQRDLWAQAVNEGQVDGQTARQVWLPAPDACPVCLGIVKLNPDGVPIGQPFESANGPVMGPGDPHPHCRCGVALVFDTVAQAEAA